MKKSVLIVSACMVFLAWMPVPAAIRHFITRSGDRLMEGDRPFRFVSFNIPNLHYVEDQLPFGETNPWRLPDAYEIGDGLESVRQAGGRVVRIYTLSVRKADDPAGVPRHVLGPGRFNENAFRAFDKMLELANAAGIRIIVPLVDNWSWWGGVAEYAAFRNKPRDAFWTDPELIADFKKTVDFVTNRKNSLTGVAYKDEKAVMAWETGNELVCPQSWTREIAGAIRSHDKNHLIIDGFHASVLKQESLDDPATDVVTTHHYPKNAEEMVRQVSHNRSTSMGVKPYFVGEFGFVPTPGVRVLLDTVIQSGVSGALVWSLRVHNRDGGFYWHSEPFGGDLYKAYHWPGFSSGSAYDEMALLALMQQKAFEIQGHAPPAAVPPEPPRLLPIPDPAFLSWQGSAGASSYTVERSGHPKGPWTVVQEGVSDADCPYRPACDDSSAEAGRAYWYRVRAVNRAGASAPSNTVGPVQAAHRTRVDELRDRTGIHRLDGPHRFETKAARKAKEDPHRLRGESGTSLVYRVDGPLVSWKAYAFLPNGTGKLGGSVSANGSSYRAVSCRTTSFRSGQDAYGTWEPVLVEPERVPPGMFFLKIEFEGEIQLTRMEITHGPHRGRRVSE